MRLSGDRRSGVVLLIALTLGFCSLARGVEFAGGTGEPNDPYQIATAAQLVAMGSDPGLMAKHFTLIADMDLDPNLPGGRIFDQAVIGAQVSSPGDRYFTGRFDGGGHIIRNLVLRTELPRPIGLFADISRGRVERLGIEDADVRGAAAVGILAGENGGIIEACYTTGTVRCVRGSQAWRKAVAEQEKTTAEYDQTMLKELEAIYGREYVQQYIVAPKFEVEPSVEPAKLGGLVGINYRLIESCYSAAAVYATCADGNSAQAGGLAGANRGRIMASYSSGLVKAKAAGLVGRDPSLSSEDALGEVFLSHWDIQASGVTSGGAGIGKTTAEMMNARTFRGWDCSGSWTINDGKDCPRLSWEKRAGTPIPGLQAFVKGSGQARDPFVVESAEELALIGRFRTSWDKHFVLGRDIDMNGADPNAILPIGNRYLPFTGHFDGRGHSIDHFTLSSNAGPVSAGFFGVIGKWQQGPLPSDAVVENLTLRNASASAAGRVGALAGENTGTIRACHAQACTIKGSSAVGGLVGLNRGHLVGCSTTGEVHGEGDNIGGLVGFSVDDRCLAEGCRSECRVSGQKTVGGLVGSASGNVRNCFATGHVSGSNEVGGLIGAGGHVIRACFATGNVTGKEHAGGLIGGRAIAVIACYATGRVSGTTEVGGLVGYNAGGVVASYATGPVTGQKAVGGLIGSQHLDLSWLTEGEAPERVGTDLLCYWDLDTSGVTTSDGGTGKSTQELMQAQTLAGWDLDGLWVLDEGKDYPQLAWQNLPGKAIRSDPNRYGGGAGTATDPFQIHKADQLCMLARHPGDFDNHFVLARDLDFARVDPNRCLPIGIEGFPFVGTFDGQGHTISNVAILHPDVSNIGLFGCAGPVGYNVADSALRIMNLNMTNVRLEGQDCVGGIVGLLGKGVVTGCSVTGQMKGDGCIGGLAGWSDGEVTACTTHVEVVAHAHAGALIGHNLGVIRASGARGRVSGEDRLGGLVGMNADYLRVDGSWNLPCPAGAGGRIMQCYADCVVTGNEELGGLVGYTAKCGRIESCYARGQVSGPNCVGGLVGYFTQSEIIHSHSAAVVQGKEKVGGFVGEDPDEKQHKYHQDYIPGVLQSCFWDRDVTGASQGIGTAAPGGLTALGSAEMKTRDAFVNAGWDFESVWMICEGKDYPRLQWEGVRCEE